MRIVERSSAERPAPWLRTALLIVVPVVAGTGASVTLLLMLVDVSTPRDQIEVLKTGFTVGAGIAGMVALTLAGRRQWVTEHANRATEHDASERRVTDLYTKAVDQLGSEQAAVRLGGLYALERLGNANPTQDETIGNVICAYLRMPYTTPADIPPEDPVERDHHDKLLQERETRRAALDILARHGADSADPWFGLRIRLQRANLADADLARADLTHAVLTHADLTHANLNHANLTHADLTGATLTRTKLNRAKLNQASLTAAKLTNANLIDANLSHANLNHANLTRANLTQANLTHANLTLADLSGAKRSGAVGLPKTGPR